MELNEEYIDTDLPTGDEPQSDEQPVPAKAKDDGAETLKDIRAELKNLRSRLSETETDARYWREQAKTSTRQEPEPEEDVLDPGEDLLEVFSSGDPKRVATALKKMGFTRQSDVQQAIGTTRQEISAQQALYGKYPDLADTESDLFKATAAVYNDLASDPTYKKSPKTIEVAARMAAAELGLGAARPKARRDAEVDDYDERETERVRRVGAQAGERGRPRSRSGRDTGEDSSSELNAMQRSLIAKFRAAGSTVSEEGYRKRAESGVRMSGLPTRGRR
jgi:hypothetical protein